MLDVRNMRGADCGSDHHLIVGVIRLHIQRANKKRNVSRRTKFNVSKLERKPVKQVFIDTLRVELKKVSPANDIDSKWTAVKSAFLTTGGLCSRTSEELKENMDYR